jgi:hypothetical protein
MVEQREQIINSYLAAYNNFDVAAMIQDFDPAICFRNFSNGEINMTLNGVDQFIQQAEKAKLLFSQRQQVVKSFNHKDDQTEIEVEFYGVLAADIPNGPKKGDELNLSGRSIFRFDQLTITELTDIS